MPSSNLSQILKTDMTKTFLKEAKTWQDLEDLGKHSSFTGLPLINNIQSSMPILSYQKTFFLSSICAFLKSKFQSWLLGSLLHHHITIFCYCTNEWHKLPNAHLQCLSSLASLLFTFPCRPANFVLP